MQNIDDFIEQLLVDKGITNVEPDIREELKADMKKRLIDQINREAIMELSEEKATELEQKADDPNFTNEDFNKFLEDAGVNVLQVTLNTMLKFRGFYLGTEEE